MQSATKVLDYLQGRDVACALIGGVALGAHGVARGTLDTDILVSDRRVLEVDFWNDLRDLGSAEIRRGDDEDPLVGLVRFSQTAEPVDVLVGRSPWTDRILDRRQHVSVRSRSLPIVERTDLVMLKLYAGGPQDLLDVSLLLAIDEETIASEVEARLAECPAVVGKAWRQVRGRRR
jgi:hypothetical protein